MACNEQVRHTMHAYKLRDSIRVFRPRGFRILAEVIVRLEWGLAPQPLPYTRIDTLLNINLFSVALAYILAGY